MRKISKNDLTFREIIQGNFIYADKTGYIYDILKDDPTSFCFLSRPRRFGKTLLLNTLAELFQGDRELFRGLLIEKKGYKFERHPVVKFNMAFSQMSSKDELISRIMESLLKMARREGVDFIAKSYGEMLGELLEGICIKYGAKVVVLIDEYDAPVTRNILRQDVAKEITEVLHNFYTSLKTNIEFIRLAFVTGITRFAMTALDSGPNNFYDISLVPEFGGICGFTKSEMRTLFHDRFPDTLDALKGKGRIPLNTDIDGLKAMIEDYYDGY
ncbi:MAG: AAA family ATPase, partial [Deltaproteobacteria bacterium]|nr:AAA family ATPase [Deltaproteobacteria bacterium]